MMNQTNKKRKVLALCLLVAAALSLPRGALGQGGDAVNGSGFTHEAFGNSYSGGFTHQSYGNSYSGDFTHQSFGNSYSGGFTHQSFGNSHSGDFTHQAFGNSYSGDFTHQAFGAGNEGNFTHQPFGNNAPLGSGLLVLLTTGAGYAAVKRQKQNKKH